MKTRFIALLGIVITLAGGTSAWAQDEPSVDPYLNQQGTSMRINVDVEDVDLADVITLPPSGVVTMSEPAPPTRAKSSGPPKPLNLPTSR